MRREMGPYYDMPAAFRCRMSLNHTRAMLCYPEPFRSISPGSTCSVIDQEMMVWVPGHDVA